jgi:hypothetical protein
MRPTTDTATTGDKGSLQDITQLLSATLTPAEIGPHWLSELPAGGLDQGVTMVGAAINPTGYSGGMVTQDAVNQTHNVLFPVS